MRRQAEQEGQSETNKRREGALEEELAVLRKKVVEWQLAGSKAMEKTSELADDEHEMEVDESDKDKENGKNKKRKRAGTQQDKRDAVYWRSQCTKLRKVLEERRAVDLEVEAGGSDESKGPGYSGRGGGWRGKGQKWRGRGTNVWRGHGRGQWRGTKPGVWRGRGQTWRGTGGGPTKPKNITININN